MTPRRILIVHENAGAGHRRAARIIADALRPAPGVEIVAEAGSVLFDNGGAALIGRLWNALIRRGWFGLADRLINFGFRNWLLPVFEVLDTPKVLRHLDRLAPDIIVCTADGYAKVLGTHAHERGIPFFQVITEMSIFFDLVHPRAVHLCYFPETVAAVRSLPFDHPYFARPVTASMPWRQRLAYVHAMFAAARRDRRAVFRDIEPPPPRRNDARVRAIGPLVDSRFHDRRDRAEARRRLGLDPARPCVLVIGGSIGGRFVTDAIRALTGADGPPLTLLAVCGHDAATARWLKKQTPSPNHALQVFGHVDNMPDLLVAADAVVARPSAGVVLEALVTRTPLVLPIRTTANDQGSLSLVRRHRLGAAFADFAGLPDALARVLAEHAAMVTRMDRLLADFPADANLLAEQLRQILLCPTPDAAAS